MPSNTLVLDFQAPELGKNLFLKPPSLLYFVRVASRLIQIISIFENLKSRLLYKERVFRQKEQEGISFINT